MWIPLPFLITRLICFVSNQTSCVFKFGGSSLANAERVDHVARLIQEQIDTQNIAPRAVVCSAMGKTTNNLLSAGEFALGTFTFLCVLKPWSKTKTIRIPS